MSCSNFIDPPELFCDNTRNVITSFEDKVLISFRSQDFLPAVFELFPVSTCTVKLYINAKSFECLFFSMVELKTIFVRLFCKLFRSSQLHFPCFDELV